MLPVADYFGLPELRKLLEKQHEKETEKEGKLVSCIDESVEKLEDRRFCSMPQQTKFVCPQCPPPPFPMGSPNTPWKPLVQIKIGVILHFWNIFDFGQKINILSLF